MAALWFSPAGPKFPMPMPLFRWLASIGCPPGPKPMPMPPSPSEMKRESQKCRLHLLTIALTLKSGRVCIYRATAVSVIPTNKPGSIHNTGTFGSSPFQGTTFYMQLQIEVCNMYKARATKNQFTWKLQRRIMDNSHNKSHERLAISLNRELRNFLSKKASQNIRW